MTPKDQDFLLGFLVMLVCAPVAGAFAGLLLATILKTAGGE